VTDTIAVVGAGGHAKVVIATAQDMGLRVLGVYDDDPARLGTSVLAVPVRGSVAAAINGDTPVVLAIGDNQTRRRIGAAATCPFAVLVHPRAYVHTSVRLGAGTVVFAGAVIQPDTVLGRHCIVNTTASIDHDNLLGDHVHVAPGSHLAGNVTVGEGALIGVGSSIIRGARVGAWSTVGVGSVCVRDVPENVVAYGSPARVRREQIT
jgi:sugar O-acyltransferase (sialic acid O-acetyltransferase NeuD family)